MAASVLKVSSRPSQLLFSSLCRYQSYVIRHSSNVENGAEKTTVEYPPVRPRWPPGGWSNMTEKDAWKLHEESLDLKAIPSAKLRLEKLAGTEPEMLVGTYPYAMVPERAKYYKYITKTHIIENELPQIYKEMDVSHIVNKVKPEIDGKLLDWSKFYSARTDKFSNESVRHSAIGTVLNELISTLSFHNEHLLRSQIDENCRVETFWRRGGYGQPDDTPMEQKHYRSTRLGTMVLEMMKYQYYHRANWQVRTELPLTPVSIKIKNNDGQLLYCCFKVTIETKNPKLDTLRYESLSYFICISIQQR